MTDELKYWLPFMTAHGEIWLEGPFETREEAMAARDRAKLTVFPPEKYGSPFPASTEEEALKGAPTFVW